MLGLASVAFSFLEEANFIYLTATESYYYFNLYCTQNLNLFIRLDSEGSRKNEKDTLWLQSGEALLFGKAENMFFEPKLKNDQAEEPDLGEPRNGDVFSHCHESWTSELLAKTLTKITETLDLSNLEPEQNHRLKGNKEEVCITHGNGGPEIQNVEAVLIDVSNCRICILDKLKTCWDFKSGKYTNVFPVITDFNSLLYSCYKSSKLIDGSIAVGNQYILEGADIDKIKRLQRRLVRESWRPGIGRRVLIDKRAITILSRQDKIIAISIQQVLEFIYEGSFYRTEQGDLDYTTNHPVFLDSSHGFRSHFGCHTAIVVVKRMSAANWLYKGEIDECFDNINQKRLLNIIKEHIKDQKLQNILNKFFQAPIKHVKLSGFGFQSGSGLSWGNPLSPILSNIFLHKLDVYINDLKKEVGGGKLLNMHGNKVSRNFTCMIGKYIKVEKVQKTKPYTEKSMRWDEFCRCKINPVKKLNLILPDRSKVDPMRDKPIHSKMYSVRYADNFLVGIRGSLALMWYVRDKLHKYLKFKLLLNITQNSKVYHVRSDIVFFLGYEVRFPRKQEKKVVYARRELSFNKLRNWRLAKQQGLQSRYARVLQAQVNTAKRYRIKKFLGRQNGGIERFLRQDIIKELEAYVDHLKKISRKEDLINPLGEFQEWRKRIKNSSETAWVKNYLEKNLDLSSVLVAYDQSMDVMDQNISKDKTFLFEKQMIDKVVKGNFTSYQKNIIKYSQPPRINLIVNAPLEVIKTCLRSWFMLHEKTATPRAVAAIFKYHVVAIIQYFTNKARGILNYYCICKNFWIIKQLVNYQMRWSLIYTLAGKYKGKVHQMISKFGKTPQVFIQDKNGNIRRVCSFLTPEEIQSMPRTKIVGVSREDTELTFKTPICRLSVPKIIYQSCVIINCKETQVELYHIRKLASYFVRNGILRSVKTKVGLAKIQQTVLSTFARKQVPLCTKHYNAWYRGEIDPCLDVNMTYFVQDVVLPGEMLK
jgi:retron-type reverse transcriptase